MKITIKFECENCNNISENQIQIDCPICQNSTEGDSEMNISKTDELKIILTESIPKILKELTKKCNSPK
jgi:recombinational DNA repair protein RecR